MSIVFKLKHRDITRRVALSKLPRWDALAEKLSSVFLIPTPNVGVSYIDTDGEEITLNSQEELDDFYRTAYRHGESIKFTVRNLSTSQFMSSGATSHRFAFHHPPPSPPPFPPGFSCPASPHYAHPYPELTLSYGMPPPPPLPPPFPPLHHHQATQLPISSLHHHDQPQSNEGIGHEPHGLRGHHRHRQRPPNRAFRWHHHAPPSLPSLSVTLWGPHGPPHPPPPDHFFGDPLYHPHTGLPPGTSPHHEIPYSVPHSSHTFDSDSPPPHPACPRSSDPFDYETRASTGDIEIFQEEKEAETSH